MPNDYYDRLDIDGDDRPIQDTAGRALIAELDTDKADRSELATVATTGDYNDLSNLPTIPAAQVPSDWDATAGVARILNKPNLSAVATSGDYSDLNGAPTLAPVATSGDYDDLSNLPFIPSRTSQLVNDSEFVPRPSLATVALSGDYDDLSNKPNLAAVATSGDYSDLSNAPLLATVATTGEYNDLVNPPALAQVATTGDYNDLGNLPILAAVATSGDYDDLTDKPTFKTINGDAITGTGNIETPRPDNFVEVKNSGAAATTAGSGSWHNDYSWTFPEKGLWLVQVSLTWDSNATGYRMSGVNTSVAQPAATNIMRTPAASGNQTTHNITIPIMVTSTSQSYYLVSYQNSGQALTTYPRINIVRLIPT